MSNKIILKKSSVSGKVPLNTDLDFGELAINYADGFIYYKRSDGSVQSLASGLSGWSGISGYSGTSGYSGWSGISGYSGFSGISGASGISGYSGFSGISGYSGASGISGYSGFSGISGASGISGYSGWSGISGASGHSGISGYSGWSGISGYSGTNGLSGTSGWSGISGYSGWSGISGYSGLNGPSTAINATNDTATTALYPVMVGASGSNQTPKVTTGSLSFNASTGALTATQFLATSNGSGTNVKIGDDAWLGDVNVADTLRIQGVSNAANGYIVFGNSDTVALGRSGTGALTYGGNTIWHAGNDGSGSGLDADLLDGNHASAFYLATNPSGYITSSGSISGSAASLSGTATTAINSSALGSGTANSTTYLRGDRTWATLSSGIWSRKTSAYTASAGDLLIADTSGGAFTITLPATPTTGVAVTIADGASWKTANLTVARNGSTIEGLSEDLVLDIAGIQVQLVYDSATWEVYTFAAPAVAAAVGGGTDQVFFENGMQVTSNYSITTGKNAMSAGPITVNAGASVTIPTGSTWTIV